MWKFHSNPAPCPVLPEIATSITCPVKPHASQPASQSVKTGPGSPLHVSQPAKLKHGGLESASLQPACQLASLRLVSFRPVSQSASPQPAVQNLSCPAESAVPADKRFVPEGTVPADVKPSPGSWSAAQLTSAPDSPSAARLTPSPVFLLAAQPTPAPGPQSASPADTCYCVGHPRLNQSAPASAAPCCSPAACILPQPAATYLLSYILP